MDKLTDTKKPASQDWHKADIKAALEKRGYTLRRLSAERGWSESYLRGALWASTPKAQAILAEVIGVAPHHIWPSRYETDGSPKRGLHNRKAMGKPLTSTRKPYSLKPFKESLGQASAKGNAKVQSEV
jgi:Ner family transcriptional regulator